MRVAFVHDYLTQYGGAERVLLEMHKLYPQAPVYTSLYRPEAFAGRFHHISVRTSFLQRIPTAARHFREMLPLYPLAFRSLDLRGYDLVISSTTSFAKAVRVPAHTLHVCYVNTPTRFLWYPDEYAGPLTPALAQPLLWAATPLMKRWDFAAAQRPHFLIANSFNVARRIMECYRRHSDVLHCPVDVEELEPKKQPGAEQRGEASLPFERGEPFYLVMTRLLPYKRVELAVAACNALSANLLVVGSGPQEKRLRTLAGPTIRFAGTVSEAQRREALQRAQAVIVSGIEDLGLVALEAAAAGTPTVAFAGGGSLETVVERETGVFFHEPSPDSLMRALQETAQLNFDSDVMRAHARRFSSDAFRAKLAAFIERYVSEFQSRALLAAPAVPSRRR